VREIALATVEWTSTLDFPDVERATELMALSDPTDYPIERGEIVTSGGLRFGVAHFFEHVIEEHVEHSNALHARLHGESYLTGPLARYNLAHDRLGSLAQEAARGTSLGERTLNPFKSIIVRAVELVQVLDEAVELVERYEEPDAPFVEVTPRRGVGHGASEAPRGLLYHRYEIDEDGTILDAQIVPPTSQNQLAIEEDLRAVVTDGIDLPDEQLTLRCEQAIRNHDPCISCATHFLELTIDRA
jgi:coenzyme F420-reducing hydrogenase alpha subunit